MAEHASPGDFTRQFESGLPQQNAAEQKPATGGATLAFEKLFAAAPAAESSAFPDVPTAHEPSAVSGAGGDFTQLFEPAAAGEEAPELEAAPDIAATLAHAPAAKIEPRIEMDPVGFAASEVTLDIPPAAAAAAASPTGFTGLFAPEVVSAPSQPKVNAPASMSEFADSQPAASPAGSFTALFNTPPSTEYPTQ